ncbi:acyl-coenzyme A:6-aminopenicillanic acid acyl-transferase-domain-containing protein [Aspergillus cavernicola]|uniref:Acyl-coenzyme A:6-aminopenicillanic acid acyl-transferase-domain-containing protein n=1 Tax=Aspergillus cavernicola TaxID=176166 RepID=A0ABR4IZV9_9EURO
MSTPTKSWNGVPEVTASGTPWTIGHTHGSQIPSRIAQCIKNYEKLFLETAGVSWSESKTRAATYLPALEQNEPDLVEEMKGIAAGAGVEFLDILALNLRSEISLTNYSDGCTSIVTRGNNNTSTKSAAGGVYLAQNWDWVGEASSSTTFFDITPAGKPRIRMMGEAGIVAKFGLNDAGVGICMNAIRSGSISKSQLPVHLAMRRVLECRSFDGALEMLNKKGLASCVNLMIADKSGKIATVECTPKGVAVIYPEPGSWTTWHTNHLWSPDIPAGIRDHPSKNSFSRLERIKVLSWGQVGSVEKIRSWLSDEEGTPMSICRSTPPGARGIERMETLSTIIMDLAKMEVQVSFGRPCLSPPVRVLPF